jgi:hypothetical protein
LVVEGIKFAHLRFRCKTVNYTGTGYVPKRGSVGYFDPESSGFVFDLECLDVFISRGCQGPSSAKAETGAVTRTEDLISFDTAITDGVAVVTTQIFNRYPRVIDLKNGDREAIVFDVEGFAGA